MKVYVVAERTREWSCLRAVFSTRQLADDFLSLLPKDAAVHRPIVEECEVDAADNRPRRYWYHTTGMLRGDVIGQAISYDPLTTDCVHCTPGKGLPPIVTGISFISPAEAQRLAHEAYVRAEAEENQQARHDEALRERLGDQRATDSMAAL